MKTLWSFVAALMLTPAICSAAELSLNEALQKGLFEEEAKRNLEAAIAAYEGLLNRFDTERQTAATAVFRLGECYRKQGKTNEAVRYYQRLVQEFGNETALVTLSRQNLVALGATNRVGNTEGRQTAAALPSDNESVQLRGLAELVKNSPDLINTGDNSNQTPLDLAAYNGFAVVTRYLLAQGADPNRRGRDGNTALHWATSAGRRTIVELLLEHHADPNIRNKSGRTPLHIAAAGGFKSVAELLIAKNANVNARDNEDKSPLQLAVEKDFPVLLQLLLANKADATIVGQAGDSLIHVAARAGSRASAESLLNTQANININATNTVGKTPLHVAIEIGQLDMVMLLLDRGGDVRIGDLQGNTPLHAAAIRSFSKALVELLEHKPQINQTNVAGYTALHEGVENQRVESIKVLLDHGANPNIQLPDGKTPVHSAALTRNAELLQLLLEHKADPNVLDKAGNTPLSLALGFPQSSANVALVSLLKSAGADEKLQRASTITVSRTLNGPGTEIFRSNPESANRFTFLELIGTMYGRGAPFTGALPYPDFNRGTVDRIRGDALKTLNLESILTSGVCTNDFWLEAGDRLVLPEADHRLIESWPGIPESVANMLVSCLRRTVTISIRNESTQVVLEPKIYRKTGRPRPVPDQFLPGEEFQMPSFWLRHVIARAGVLRASSDQSRVRVQRLDRSLGDLIVDLANSDKFPAQDIWLRDGDIITIPEKQR